MAIPDYKLSTVLHGHSLDVRSVAATKDDCILSASRDRTAKLWHPEGIKDFQSVVTYKGHVNFVSSICWLPPCESHPDGLVITGSNDNSILGYNLQDGTPVVTIKGHENAVCCVRSGLTPGTILSASWDNTGCIWNFVNKEPITTFKGHQAAVWSIIEINDGFIATASADKTIGLWNKSGAKLKTLTGHTDCVRDLVACGQDSFLSCANDATIRLWTINGECLNTYYGHNNYIYSICMNPSVGPECFVTSGEDSTVRVWIGGDNVCTMTLPAQSIWTVTCLSNGDIVAGSSDGVVRVFSKDVTRYADENTQALFAEEVLKIQAASKQEIGGVKVTDLPGSEVLFEPGKTDGQTKLVRSGAGVKCYSWSAAAQTWNEIGDVTGAVGPAEGKTRYEGKDYDFVFSVDIEDGTPPLKLPYNMGEDPWVVAQAFIHKNQLPQAYLEQVANFIITNSKQDAMSLPNNGEFHDPLTGASRYIPNNSSNVTAQTGINMDPFTGGSSYSSRSNSGLQHIPDSAKPLIPHKNYIRFDQANLSQILEKLKEFNRKVGDKAMPISDKELEGVVKLAELNSSFTMDNVTRLKQLLTWPEETLFPVLDVVRLAIRNPELNADFFGNYYGPTFVKLLIENLKPNGVSANQMLAMRVFVNAFSHLPGEMAILKENEGIVNLLLCLQILNKNAQIAAASLLLNLSVALGQQKDTTDLCECILQQLCRFTDQEAYFRALVALGTLLADSPNKVPLQSKVVSNVQFSNRLKKDCNLTSEDPTLKKISTCSQQLVLLL